jgi:pyruvate ferredoxin oxidoreductase alpha subunit
MLAVDGRGAEMKNVMEGSIAVAHAIKACDPQVIPVYPITPQTHIPEELTRMAADGEIDSEMINVESEHSAMAACIGAQATGVRSYTATSSQGLALMHEMLFIASGMRLPIVMTVVNRALSAPLNIWNDQQDSFSERDSGWIQLYVEDNQEAYDTHVQAFKIAEETDIPVMVCMDGFILSHTYEPIDLLAKADVKKFLPDYKPKFKLDPSAPVTMGALATPQYYMQFRKQQQDAIEGSKAVIKRVNREFSSISGRSYGDGLIETINMKGKKHAIVAIGSVTGTLREIARDVGIVKIRSLRPFPAEEVMNACKGLDSVGVIEKDVSIGARGALYDEIRSALYGSGTKVSGFIAGLGGKDITEEDLEGIVRKVKLGKEIVEWI